MSGWWLSWVVWVRRLDTDTRNSSPTRQRLSTSYSTRSTTRPSSVCDMPVQCVRRSSCRVCDTPVQRATCPLIVWRHMPVKKLFAKNQFIASIFIEISRNYLNYVQWFFTFFLYSLYMFLTISIFNTEMCKNTYEIRFFISWLYLRKICCTKLFNRQIMCSQLYIVTVLFYLSIFAKLLNYLPNALPILPSLNPVLLLTNEV